MPPAMSPRSARMLLWLGLALMAPLPVAAGVATGLMPVARMAMLAGLCGLVVLLENANGAVGLLCLLFLAQALAYLAVLWGVAHATSRLLARLSPRSVAVATALLLAGGVALTAAFDWYETPFRLASTHASLFEIFE